jgi:hypothetical protein
MVFGKKMCYESSVCEKSGSGLRKKVLPIYIITASHHCGTLLKGVPATGCGAIRCFACTAKKNG